MKTIVLQPSAARALDRLPAETRSRIGTALVTYALNGSGDIKRLVGTQTVRLRVGEFRVIFDETPDRILVLVLGNRRDIYR
jgi:mRNA interferase RelE/StbE